MKRYDTFMLDGTYYDLMDQRSLAAYYHEVFLYNRAEGIRFLEEQYRNDPEARAKIDMQIEMIEHAAPKFSQLLDGASRVNSFAVVIGYLASDKYPPAMRSLSRDVCMRIYDFFGVPLIEELLEPKEIPTRPRRARSIRL